MSFLQRASRPSPGASAAPAGPMRTGLERLAWAIPLSTRRLFLALAVTVAGMLATSGVAAAWVAMRNADTIADARVSGLGLSSAVTELGTRLAASDADAATMLLSGGQDGPVARSGYDPDLLDTGRPLAGYHPHLVLAARALADAGVVATDDDRGDLRTLNDGLVRYSGLVETARTNARQGNPVSAAYLEQARTIAQVDLLPLTSRLRRAGEQRMASAANSVGGPVSAVTVGLTAAASVMLAAAALVVAGRSRRLAHPALLVATAGAIGALVVVTASIWSQSRELREVATTDIGAYVTANEIAADLSDLRVTEISAVAAQGGGEASYEDFHQDADRLAQRLDGPDGADLLAALQGYVDQVEAEEAADEPSGSQRAAASALRGASATQFRVADDTASNAVVRAQAQLEDRFEAVADAGVEPLLPAVLGLVAAALAASGILDRGRRYR
jgi:hypothetical protein